LPTIPQKDNDMSHAEGAGSAGGGLASLVDLGHRVADKITRFGTPLALLALRLPIAIVFWRSGRTKVEGWNIFAVNDVQYLLFREEFGLSFPELMAHVTAVAEHVLPILLVLGLFTRLGALGMLTMTMVIQLFVFPDAWFTAHMFWATILFAVVVLGPGAISLDRLLFRP
jgi:putative oxidoreductase